MATINSRLANHPLPSPSSPQNLFAFQFKIQIMKPVSHLLPSLFFFFFVVFLPVVSPSASTFPVNIWPKPTTISWPSPATSPLSPFFTILSSHPFHSQLSAAVSRYHNLLLFEPLVPPSLSSCSVPLSSLSISISKPSAPLHHAADESYSLSFIFYLACRFCSIYAAVSAYAGMCDWGS
ncbi:hypothetical protein KSP39_PZI005525 [Platanthera zijinensis]|uniref:Beta-hexosaminidase eukaryotic type N-terminal domain-containing protein n=1 Tax=Platanthera zijinensis TaxID=2320716 RepID=A0AAP0GAX9_9ASPA